MSFGNNQLMPSDSPLLFFEELGKIWDYFFRGALPLVHSTTEYKNFADLFGKRINLKVDENHYLQSDLEKGWVTLIIKTKSGNYFISVDERKKIKETRLIGLSGGIYYEYLSPSLYPEAKSITTDTRFFDEYGDPCFAVLSTFTGGRLTFEYIIFNGIIRHSTELFLTENSKRCVLFDKEGSRLRIQTFDEKGFVVLEQFFDKRGLNHIEAEFQLQNFVKTCFSGVPLNYFVSSKE